ALGAIRRRALLIARIQLHVPTTHRRLLGTGQQCLQPSGGPVLVAYDLTADVGPVVDNGRTATSFISTGIKGVLPRGWQLRPSTAYSKSSTRFFEYNNLNTGAIDVLLASADPATALNLFGDGSHTARATLAALRNQSVALDYPDEFTTAMASVIADGTLF